jgi:hypothetical protein
MADVFLGATYWYNILEGQNKEAIFVFKLSLIYLKYSTVLKTIAIHKWYEACLMQKPTIFK